MNQIPRRPEPDLLTTPNTADVLSSIQSRERTTCMTTCVSPKNSNPHMTTHATSLRKDQHHWQEVRLLRFSNQRRYYGERRLESSPTRAAKQCATKTLTQFTYMTNGGAIPTDLHGENTFLVSTSDCSSIVLFSFTLEFCGIESSISRE